MKMPRLAAVINENFIAVKVDRDERPDVDSRYQAAVSAISGQGGWPLTAVSYSARAAVLWRHLLSAGTTATAGPASSACCAAWRRRGRRAATRFWSRPAAWWRRLSITRRLPGAGASLSRASWTDGRIGAGNIRSRTMAALDRTQVSPSCGARSAAGRGRTHRATQRRGNAATVTLEKMARGGVYDQLAGGFHRYSVDEQLGRAALRENAVRQFASC